MNFQNPTILEFFSQASQVSQRILRGCDHKTVCGETQVQSAGGLGVGGVEIVDVSGDSDSGNRGCESYAQGLQDTGDVE